MALFSKEAPPPRPQQRGPEPPAAGTLKGTYLGPNVIVDGTVSGNEPVFVEGTVKGRINLRADLRIGTQARVEATVHAKNVVVEGKLEGDVSADERVELVASATVDGNIRAPKIVVAEGARFRGSVDMGKPKEGAQEPSAAKK
jgi:cytoskeletal protein CcmA (bactofilin family)